MSTLNVTRDIMYQALPDLSRESLGTRLTLFMARAKPEKHITMTTGRDGNKMGVRVDSKLWETLNSSATTPPLSK